ncbi:MAG: type II toxin-antitoxin system VapC family toxin [Acidobacteriota bacterium]|nr:MAG: type II toxin-antitoxin system VapC family toxin [Acidobacteriota bacterium]
MKYVLDTNTVSFLMRGDVNVSRKLTSHDRTDVFLPQPVVAEIEYGLARLSRSARKKRLVERFEIVRGEIQRAIWTDEVSRAFGVTEADLERRGVRLEDFDVAVAAHALALNATMVTDNVAHMKRVGALRIENWHD